MVSFEKPRYLWRVLCESGRASLLGEMYCPDLAERSAKQPDSGEVNLLSHVLLLAISLSVANRAAPSGCSTVAMGLGCSDRDHPIHFKLNSKSSVLFTLQTNIGR